MKPIKIKAKFTITLEDYEWNYGKINHGSK